MRCAGGQCSEKSDRPYSRSRKTVTDRGQLDRSHTDPMRLTKATPTDCGLRASTRAHCAVTEAISTQGGLTKATATACGGTGPEPTEGGLTEATTPEGGLPDDKLTGACRRRQPLGSLARAVCRSWQGALVLPTVSELWKAAFHRSLTLA